MVKSAASAGFGSTTLTFWYDTESGLLTRCEAEGVSEGDSFAATAAPVASEPWTHTFTVSESVDVPNSVPFDGTAFQFRQD